MKKIFLILSLLMIFAGCSDNPVDPNDPKVIRMKLRIELHGRVPFVVTDEQGNKYVIDAASESTYNGEYWYTVKPLEPSPKPLEVK